MIKERDVPKMCLFDFSVINYLTDQFINSIISIFLFLLVDHTILS
jgi:hypothetical protein